MILKGKVRLGFSLTELMLALLLTLIISSGLVATFRSIRSTTADSARTNSITTSLKSLSNQMRYDFLNAGKGLSDLSIYNVQYEFVPAFENEVNNGKFMYGVTDHIVDANGDSNITLQWFDYEVNRGMGSITPTFLFSFDDPNNSNPLTGGTIHSNNTGALDAVQEGDIFLVYNIQPMLTSNTSQYLRDEPTKPAPWNNANLQPDNGVGNNAVLVQVTNAGGRVAPADSSLQHSVPLTFGLVDGGVFTNNYPGGGLRRDMNGAAVITNAPALTLANLSVNGTGAITEPHFLARKLGNSSNFHRVTYYVETAPDGTRTLMREHNSDAPEVIATNINRFEVELGFDVNPATAPVNVLLADQNGSVSAVTSDPDAFWLASADAYPGSAEDYHVFTGRHAIAARVSFSLETQTETASLGAARRLERGFEQQFRINSFLPMPYM
ncbi:hypothetical protein [Acanthopleuribacter pedis]|uniref:Uncharacterized protein n=1 Tax=Acanthopleuribacter pedis TaxID=442870 RepID=A0A8J7Q5L6_9BACT|nr:hypothetical protein [Acanthopleuribacter pedis]MBO1320857.1 hypothetical protein [Acanthopleuribacter pedis]